MEQVEQLSNLTKITACSEAVYALTDEPLPIHWKEARQQWQLLQQQISEQQQTLLGGLQQLQRKINQIQLLQSISDHCDAQANVDAVLEAGLDALWQKAPLRFAVVVLGEAELGPYTYQSMRGVTDAWRFVGKNCPFPLWGVLARALLPRLDPDEPDYLIIQDIYSAKRPHLEEFPWMPLDGSLMILPLRTQDRVVGAFLLGCEAINGFSDQGLCNDYYTIAYTTARVLQIAKMRQELNDRSNQLLSLQLFTKSIAAVRDFDKLIDILVEGISETFGRVDVLVYMNDRIWSKSANAYGELEPHVRSIIDWAMQAGQPIFYDPDDNTESLERFYYNESGRALVTPIIRGERTLGVIQIVAKEAARYFEEGDMIVLRTIANSVAIVLESMVLRLFGAPGE
ncbi:MAG: GAF domain-containing protein [Caldilineaceae bacterium]